MDIKILVATHKAYWMPNDEVYLPLHVGADCRKDANGNPLDLGFIKDNTGYNISSKNPNYCELTGLYWAWKNLDCDYIGLCHYRRYFAHKPKSRDLKAKQMAIFTRADYENLLSKYDVVLPTKRNYYIETIRSHYEHAHYKTDLDTTEQVLREMYPDYLESFYTIMNGTKLHILNMFVMKKSLFDEYCQWLFTILFEVEKRIDISNRDDYQKRVFGFLGERLFNVWLEKKSLNVVEVEVINLEPVDWFSKIYSFLKRKLGIR